MKARLLSQLTSHPAMLTCPVRPTETLEVARQMVGCRKNPDGSCGAAGHQAPLGEQGGPREERGPKSKNE